MKLAVLVVAVLVGSAGCAHVRPRSAPIGAGAELTQLADAGSNATFEATYRYTTAGPLAPGVGTRMQVVQRPPTSVRKLETSTTDPTGRAVTVRTWQATDARGSYSCTDYSGIGVRCIANALPAGTFRSAQLDQLFDAPRRAGVFSNVARAGGSVRIAGQAATCFLGTPAAGAEPATYELCYTSDGILLRARRSLDSSVPASVDARRLAVIEAVAVSRAVPPNDLRLPGPITDPRDLRQ